MSVSRDAMYHHFASKREIFEAVFREVSDETIRAAVLVAVNDAPAAAAVELEHTIRQFIEGLTPA